MASTINDCLCPQTTLDALVDDTCREGGAQVGKIAFELKGSPIFTDVADGPAPATDIQDITSWNTRIAAGNLVLTPQLINPILTQGDTASREGGNDTKNGRKVIDAVNSANYAGQFANMTQAEYDALNAYNCKSEIVAIYFLSSDGVRCLKKDSSNLYAGIPVGTIFLNSISLTGHGTPDTNDFEISLEGLWQTDATFINLDFDPTDLVNP